LQKDYAWHETIWQITGNEVPAGGAAAAAGAAVCLHGYSYRHARRLRSVATTPRLTGLFWTLSRRATRKLPANALLIGLTEWNAHTRAYVFRQNDGQGETSSTEPRAAGASQAPFAAGPG